MVGGHINLVGGGGQIVGTVGRRFGVGNHGLSAFPELGQGHAELFYVGHSGDEVIGPQEDILDAGVRGGHVDGLDGVPNTQGGDHAHAEGRHDTGGHGVLLGLFGQGEIGHVDIQHAVLGEGGLAAACSQGAAEEDHHKDEANQTNHDEAADHGQHSLHKLFHNISSVALFQSTFSL